MKIEMFKEYIKNNKKQPLDLSENENYVYSS